MKKSIGIILLLVFAWVRAFSAICTPTSVQVCGIADDFETIYIDGTMVGVGNDFRFAHMLCPGVMDPWSVCPTPVCVTTTNAAILASISSTQKVTVAAQVTNAGINDVFGCWYVDVTCSNGQHAYIASDGVSTQLFSTTGTGNAGVSSPYQPSCVPNNAPPVTSGNWYDANPLLGSGWNAATVVVPANMTLSSGQIWSKQIINPATGLTVPVLSIDTTAGESTLGQDSCALLYFSQTVTLSVIPQPPPPNLTLTKSFISAQPVSTTCSPYPCYAASVPVTWSMQICNSGGPISTGPVTVIDDDASFIGGNLFAVQTVSGKFKAFNNAMDPTNADADGVVGTWQSGGLTYVFLKGMDGANFSGGTTVPYCYAATAVAWDYTLDPTSEFCTTRTNNFRTTSGVTATSNTFSVSIMCPPTPAQTMTLTPTGTNTAGVSVTPSYTPTPDPTPILTPGLTTSPTFAVTPSPTWTATLTPSSTDTFTSTRTWTPTGTPTKTPTPTPTSSTTQTWTWSVSVTSTQTPTSSLTLTPTETSNVTPRETPTPTYDGHTHTYIFPSPVKGPRATIAYQMKEAGRVRIRVWNAGAEWVAEVDEYKSAGPQTSILTVRDYAPGVYLYRVMIDYNSGGHEQLSTVRFVVLR